MLVKEIKYTDYNDQERTEKFYFNLSKSELTKMRFSQKGGFENYINALIVENDEPKLMQMFEDIILMSYGRKTPEGGFEKSEEISNKFKSTAAYDELFMELCSSTEAVTNFVNGILPKDINPDGTKANISSIPYPANK